MALAFPQQASVLLDLKDPKWLRFLKWLELSLNECGWQIRTDVY